MLENYKKHHVHMETFPVDQYGVTWLSQIDL